MVGSDLILLSLAVRAIHKHVKALNEVPQYTLLAPSTNTSKPSTCSGRNINFITYTVHKHNTLGWYSPTLGSLYLTKGWLRWCYFLTTLYIGALLSSTF